ncbi:MAG: hypothetical protein ACK4NA_08420 [Alphaproteobacteria bacterium]
MEKPRLPIAILASVLLACGLAGLCAVASPAWASGDKSEPSAEDKIRAMFGGELILHTPLPLFSIPVIRDNEVTDHVNIAIMIETKGEKNRDKIIAGRYKLYDAYLRDLYGLLAIKRADGQLFDQQVVKIRLARVSDKVLGPGVVNDILVRGISQRPIN